MGTRAIQSCWKSQWTGSSGSDKHIPYNPLSGSHSREVVHLDMFPPLGWRKIRHFLWPVGEARMLRGFIDIVNVKFLVPCLLRGKS